MQVNQDALCHKIHIFVNATIYFIVPTVLYNTGLHFSVVKPTIPLQNR